MNNELSKTIWFLWLQGLTDAPFVVKKCYQSWIEHNPGWRVIFLDEANLADHITLPARQVTHQAFSDILRINLLAKYGGVWVDATCFCIKPLDEWLYNYISTGFFAFERPGPDRMLSAWFLASAKYNYITLTYKNAVNNYWDKNPKMHFIIDTHWKLMDKPLQFLSTQVWFSSFVSRLLRVYPYFWFHYLFERIYLMDENFRELWDATPKLSADIPHQLQFAGLFDPINAETKAEIDNKTAPLYKLTWKYDEAKSLEGTNIDYLFKS